MTLDLGHVGICPRPAPQRAGRRAANPVYDALQRKSLPDLESLLEGCGPAPGAAGNGAGQPARWGIEVLDRVPAGHRVDAAMAELRQVAAAIAERYPDVDMYFDLAELRGYRYHTGLVFAAYVAEQGRASPMAAATTTSARCSAGRGRPPGSAYRPQGVAGPG